MHCRAVRTRPDACMPELRMKETSMKLGPNTSTARQSKASSHADHGSCCCMYFRRCAADWRRSDPPLLLLVRAVGERLVVLVGAARCWFCSLS